jgi:GntR family phosphonate transport system transcriptional regulator
MERVNAEIVSKAFGPGEQLPTEKVLTQRFGVNRHTVRRALDELQRRGLIIVRQGSGSYVAEELIEFNLSQYTSFSCAIAQLGRKPKWQILRTKEASADQSVANQLGMIRARQLIIVKRLLLADGFPLVMSTHHFPTSRFGKMVDLLRYDPSISAAFAALGVQGLRLVRSQVTARLPLQLEAEHLQQQRFRPVLTTESIIADREGEVVEFATAVFAPGRTRLVVE